MTKEITKIASEFLARYLSSNPSVEFHKTTVCSHKRYEVHDSNETAESFLQHVQSQFVESERIEITESASVIILRVCPKTFPRFLAGTRKDGKLIWTHHNHLSCEFSREDGEKVSKRLVEQGIPNCILPAPEVRHGSL